MRVMSGLEKGGLLDMMRRWALLVMVAIFAAGSGCASTPPERPDSKKIQQDSDKAFEDLQQEEDRTQDDY